MLVGTVLLALLAGMMPLPSAIESLRPYWIALVVLYWALESPEQLGLGLAFLIGLWADLLFGSLLAEQSMRLCILVFLVQRFRARLRFFPVTQQTLAVLALLLNDRVVALALRVAAGEGTPPPAFWLAPFTGALVWPLLYLLLDRWRMRSRFRHG